MGENEIHPGDDIKKEQNLISSGKLMQFKQLSSIGVNIMFKKHLYSRNNDNLKRAF